MFHAKRPTLPDDAPVHFAARGSGSWCEDISGVPFGALWAGPPGREKEVGTAEAGFFFTVLPDFVTCRKCLKRLGRLQIQYVEAPDYWTQAITGADDLNRLSLFLGGGITDCPDWQKEMVHRLTETRLAIYNPRRANFPIDDPEAAEEQITWEYVHLQRADAAVFWFPCETLCPIVLFELGRWSYAMVPAHEKPIFVGVHPDYKRRKDVEIQMQLARPRLKVVYDLKSLAQQVHGWIDEEEERRRGLGWLR